MHCFYMKMNNIFLNAEIGQTVEKHFFNCFTID